MWTPHYAVLDGAYWLDADASECAYCTRLLSPDDPDDEGDEPPFTGGAVPAVQAVMITWTTVTTALSLFLPFTG
ncbi:hypothetical protein [Streptomyces lavendofoliae]|uniref:hypothetical protein n=1 Tax=Streptomyces lavendofoliae TaxID=67314 RepID=UPI003D950559